MDDVPEIHWGRSEVRMREDARFGQNNITLCSRLSGSTLYSEIGFIYGAEMEAMLRLLWTSLSICTCVFSMLLISRSVILRLLYATLRFSYISIG